MRAVRANVTVFNGDYVMHRYQTAADDIIKVLTHIEWEHLIVKNWEDWRLDISLYAQEKYNATKIVIEYHFEDGEITTETITTLEK